MRNLSPLAFTLIELLVVITIIVVLLALLAPALDKAIYQAELTQCAGNKHGLANAVVIYAAEQRRNYPLRSGIYYNVGDQPCTLRQHADDRPTLRPYMPINSIQCPMTKGANLETTQSNAIWSSYRLWFGWRFVGHSGMMRLGDRWSWTTAEDGLMRFRFLISDADTIAETYPLIYTSHPDKDGALALVPFQDTPGFGIALPGGIGGAFTMWTWRAGVTRRGPIDMNFASDDSSVTRLKDITTNEVSFDGQQNSERVTWVPEDSTAGRTLVQPGDQLRTTLPKPGY